MLDTIRTKIRALVPDATKSDTETFTYESSAIFTLAESNIVTVSKVEKNGVELGSGTWDYDSSVNQVTISDSLSSGDVLVIYFTYTTYSDTELKEYVRASLVWMSSFGYQETVYELEENDINPTPDKITTDLIALVASILIKPDYSQYSLPNLTVKYPRTMTKEDRIIKLISRFKHGLGVNGILDFS